jgi:signal transduction histidine kinase
VNVLDDAEFSSAGSFARYMDPLPAAFAVTRGERHTLVYANTAFRNLIGSDGQRLVGRAIAAVFVGHGSTSLTALLDRAFRTGVVARNRRIEPVDESALHLSCTIWPNANADGATDHLVIELRAATRGETTVALQRQVAERLLLSALREQDAADVAEESRRGAAFLAGESRRLAESLDEVATLAAMKRMSLPHLGAWCIVDILDDDDTMHRLAIIHPDPAKQAILGELDGRWVPRPDDSFGLPAALRSASPFLITDDVDAALASAAHDPDMLAALRELGFGPLLTVPLVIRERLIGAVTFVGGGRGQLFTTEDLQLAEDLGSRSAMALERARLYGEAIALRVRAESASEAKSTFLGMMSHELRTPLNAIGGYVDIIDMELRGPVTEAQHADLARIRSNQRHLTGLISDLLNLTKVASGHVTYDVGDLSALGVLTASVAMLEPLISQKHLIFGGVECDAGIVARGDREKVVQVILNLLSNAVKFTAAGGRLSINGEATAEAVMMRVSDTGIGIPPDKLEVIFEPFVKVVDGTSGPDGGIGLGLAISRGLARAMSGDLTVESTLGAGARLTLNLPRSAPATI